MPEPEPVPYYPPGPALLYVHADPGEPFDEPTTRTPTRVDLDPPLTGGPLLPVIGVRERRILRALLEHALWLLDQEEEPA